MSHLTKSKSAKIVAGVLGVAIAVTLFVGVGAQVSSAQGTSLKDLVELFISLGIIAPEKATQARAAVSGGSVSSGSVTFTRNLTVGSSGEDVRSLQKFLNSNGYTVAASGAGSPGSESTHFGPATRSALARYQSAKGISPAAGYFGPLTRQSVNAASGGTASTGGTTGGTTPAPTPTGTGIFVSSPEQPAVQLAPQGAARVPFTKVTLTAGNDGDIIVNSVTVERTGLSADAAFAGIVLLDENGLQLGIAKTFNSNHQASIGEAFTVKKGTSKTLTIAGNMASDNSTRAGQVASLSVVAVNTAATVSGSLPITGAGHTINSSLSIGSISNERGPLDPNAAQTKPVGTTAYTFSAIKVTAGSVEDIRINSIRWNQASSAGASDIANVVTIVDGKEYPTTLSADGKFYTSVFSGGIIVAKGLSKEISVKADIVGGSGRTVAFNIEKTTDIYITGETYKYGITPPTSGTGFSSGTIWYAGKTLTVDTGSLTVENATSVAAQNVAPNLSNQPIGGFSVETKGEPITVSSMTFNVATTGTPAAASGGSNQLLTNVTIVDQNGTVVAGPVDATGSSATVQRLTFSDTVLFPIGKFTYTVKGKVGSNFASNGTLQVSVTPGSGSAPNFSTVTGQVTGKTITASTASVTMSTMTVKGATLTLSVSTDPAAQTIVAGAQGFAFANYKLDALSSGEDLQMSSIPLAYHAHGGSTASNLTNCNLYDGSVVLTTGSNSVNPSGESSSTTFTFDKPLTIQKGTVKTLALKCNIASGASGAYSWGYDDAQSPSATGLTSSQSVTITENESVGQKITLASAGSLTVALDSASPSYTLGAAGTADNVVSALRLRATNEAIRLTDLALTLSNTASSSPGDVTKVTLWDGSAKVGEAFFLAGSYNASSTIGNCSGCSDFVIPKDTDKVLTVKADFAAQGTSQVGAPGNFIAVDWANASGDATKGVGSASGTTINRTAGTTTASTGVRVLKAYPVFTKIDLTDTKLVAGRRDLFRFKIKATGPSGSQVGLDKITVRIATSSATQQIDMVDNLNVYGYTDSGFSTPISGLQNDGALEATSRDLSGGWGSSSTDLELYAETAANASTTAVIPAGEERYFVVRADVQLAGTTYNVSTQLQGDAKFEANLAGADKGPAFATTTNGYLATTTYLDTRGDNDFLWRAFSTSTTQAATANDFSNGYGIPGLPTTNTNTQILSN